MWVIICLSVCCPFKKKRLCTAGSQLSWCPWQLWKTEGTLYPFILFNSHFVSRSTPQCTSTFSTTPLFFLKHFPSSFLSLLCHCKWLPVSCHNFLCLSLSFNDFLVVFLSSNKPVALEIKKHGVSDESPVWSIQASTFYKCPLHTKSLICGAHRIERVNSITRAISQLISQSMKTISTNLVPWFPLPKKNILFFERETTQSWL